jgi:hypothetical protein
MQKTVCFSGQFFRLHSCEKVGNQRKIMDFFMHILANLENILFPDLVNLET